MFGFYFKQSKYNWLYQLISNRKIQIAFTTEIIIEYEGQIEIHWNTKVANQVTRLLAELPASSFILVYYNPNLITVDKDDNKFVDCAFAANADFIITNDNHFNILKNIDFPSIPVINPDEFYERLQEMKII